MAEKKNLETTEKKVEKKKEPGAFSRMAKYFREVKSEAKKVVWPDRKQVVNNTLVVVAFVFVVGAVIWGLDWAFSGLRELLFNLFA